MVKRIKYILLFSLLMTVLLNGCGKDKETSSSDKEDGKVSEQSEVTNAGTASYGEYLSISDVTDITGISELKLKENFNQLKFYSGEETNVVLDVSFREESFYEAEVGDGKYYTELSDIADKAAIAIPDAPYRITLLQGDTSVMIQTVPQDSNMKLTEDQLVEIAKLVVSRMK